MKDMMLRLAVAVTLLAAAGTASAAPAWKYVRNIGMWQFVVVEPRVSADTGTFMQAVRAICTPGRACMVVFWSDAAAVPASMPMTHAQQQAVVARYLHNPTGVHDELLLRCRADEPAGSRCLR